MDNTSIPFVSLINKLIKDLHERQIETIIVLADRHGSWKHQIASDTGLIFLDKHGKLPSEFLQFCADLNYKDESLMHQTKLKPDQSIIPIEIPVTIVQKRVDGPTENDEAVNFGSYEAHARDESDAKILTDDSQVMQVLPKATQHTAENTPGNTSIGDLKSSLKGNWQCNQCNKKFARKSTLRRHLEQIHGPASQKSYSCNLCGKTFKSAEILKKHKFHQECRCNIDNCQDVFASSVSLKKHRFIHHRDFFRKNKQFLCNICGMGFQRKHVLTAHLEWKHSVGDPEQCKICDKTFRGKVALSNHMASHRLSLKYQCEICGNSYKQRSGLYKHKMRNCAASSTRSNQTLYYCEICRKGFMRQVSLTHHLISQGHSTPSQPVNSMSILSCTECDKKFGIKDKLDKHIASVHRQMKRYKCDACDKSFSDKSNYRQHLKIHTGRKPYCSFCKKSFRSQIQLNKHTEGCQKSCDISNIDHLEDNLEDNSTDLVQSNSLTGDRLENQTNFVCTDLGSLQYTVLTSSNYAFNGGETVISSS